MTITELECKLCGGNVLPSPGKPYGVCESCGVPAALPREDSLERRAAFNLGNALRRQGSFDLALDTYRGILSADGADAEAHWCSALCRCGILYAEDPETADYYPRCCRAGAGLFTEEPEYLAALSCADGVVLRQYRREAARIAAVQRKALSAPQTAPKTSAPREKAAVRKTRTLRRMEPISALVEEGNAALERGLWERATVLFDRALDQDPVCGEAWLGKALAAAGEASPEELLRQRRRILEVAEAGKEPEPVELDMRMLETETAEEYAVPNYLSAEEVRTALASIPRGYLSRAGSRRKALEREKREFPGDRNLEQAFRCAAGGTAEILAHLREEHFAALDAWCLEAENGEEHNRKEAEKRYMAAFESVLGKLSKDTEARREADYQRALSLWKKSKNSPGNLSAAWSLFSALGTYRDAADLRAACATVRERKRTVALRRRRQAAASFIGLCAAAGLLIGVPIFLVQGLLPLKLYETAERLYENKDYTRAAAAFRDLGGYADSAGRARESEIAAACGEAELLLATGRTAEAAIAYGSISDSAEARSRSFVLWDSLIPCPVIAAGATFTVAVDRGGSVVAVGDARSGQLELSDWRDIVAVAAGGAHTVGLRRDGTVTAAGDNSCGQCAVSGWSNVMDIAAGKNHTVGLLADGTVTAVGDNLCGQLWVLDWRDIVAVAAGAEHTVGLRCDGTVVAAGTADDPACQVSEWRDIMAVAAGSGFTVGLKVDGSLVTAGSEDLFSYDSRLWQNLTSVAAGGRCMVALTGDGTILRAANNMEDYAGIRQGGARAAAVGSGQIAMVYADGTAAAVGQNGQGQCEVFQWRDLRLPTPRERQIPT